MLSFKQFMSEEGEGVASGVPANNTSGVAGIGKDVPVSKRRQKRYADENGREAKKIAPEIRKRRVMGML